MTSDTTLIIIFLGVILIALGILVFTNSLVRLANFDLLNKLFIK